MAEVLATMAIGPLVSMVMQKASSSLLEQYKVMKGMEEQHKILKRKLPAILDVIADAEMQAAEHREGAKAWLQEVRDVAYQGNNVFDEFKYEALRRKAKKEGQYRELGMDVIKLFPTHNRFVFRIKMGKRLSKILQNINILIGEMQAFNFRPQPQQQLPMERRRHTDSDIIDPMDIVSKSRAKEKKMIVDTLLDQKSNEDLTVLPIYGMGGLGKTTLSQLVYNDSKIQDHFELLVWVCVSNNFDVDFVATRIVEAITNSTVTVGKLPCHSLQEAVNGKRYLLVLDDVWNRDDEKWDKLKFYLEKGGMGSSILTTTRDESIARFMATTEPHKLGLLDQSFIEKIIKAKAFGSKASSPANELVVMVADMAKKCVGSPLAAAALGSVLRTKTSEEEWKAILSRTTICDNETGILSILNLSYNDLPSEMRQCFAFCAIFPKDYEIDVEMLIQLWMANGFILEDQGGLCPEMKGEQFFNELVYRSFFQDVKKIPFGLFHYNMFGYCSRITCKIHDLMHDVAQSAMGKECATIAAESSNKSEDIPYFSRHLFVPPEYPQNILNDFLEKSSPGLQTLLCTTRYRDGQEVQFSSKYNSIRALKLRYYSSILTPKYLHHLKYLDISGSHIRTLPEDISILYHLQVLNLSGCKLLTQLPKGMKYMTDLRHLYTDGCQKLKMMPPELRCLTSLQKLTYFIVGTPGPSCSGIAELGPLDDLGGWLEVCQLENVTETDVQAANLGNKKRLTELTLRWSEVEGTTLVQHDRNKVLEDMKPHDGIKALRLYSYGGSSCPAWMSTLHDVVDLVLSECKNIENLPPLWQLPALRFLEMSGMEKPQFFCCGGEPPFTFKKLRKLQLYRMKNLETWWDINEVQGQQEPMFPKLERLSIEFCDKLTALPKASVIKESSGTRVWRSACPALKELELKSLSAFERWEAAEETLGQHIILFPLLEKLIISSCPKLTALPKASVIKESSGTTVLRSTFPALKELKLESLGAFERWEADEETLGQHIMIFPLLEVLKIIGCPKLTALPKTLVIKESSGTTVCLSVFPALKELELLALMAFERWEADEETLGQHIMIFPLLEKLKILGCSKLTTLPKAPKLNELKVLYHDSEQIVLHVVKRYLTLVSTLNLSRPKENSLIELVCDKETWSGEFSTLRVLCLSGGWGFLFRQSSAPAALWNYFVQLEDLEIDDCDDLEQWPENVFQRLVSLRRLSLWDCRKLTKLTTGHIQQVAASEQPLRRPESMSCVLPPRLESLNLWRCDSLVEVPTPLPASLMQIRIDSCDKLESIILRKDGDRVGILMSSTSVVPNLSPSTTRLRICLSKCNNLQSLLVQMDCTESLEIDHCRSLKSVDGEFPSLESLVLEDCNSLESIPDGPPEAATYSSLSYLEIRYCPSLKVLPPCLKQRLNDIERTYLDARYTGTRLSRSWKRVMDRIHCSTGDT